jgi:hypothetical protein
MVHSARYRARGELSADAITAISRYDHHVRAIDQDRRHFAGAAATVVTAAGTLSLLTAAATEGDAIRPFHVSFLEEQLVDLRRRSRDPLAGQGDGRR